MKKSIILNRVDDLASAALLTISALMGRRKVAVRQPSANELANQARAAAIAKHNEEVERKKAAKKARK